jgi:uncharacterized phage protein (TIGR01671 family)
MIMREIKFRAWRKNNNDMLHFNLVGVSRCHSDIFEKGKFVCGLGGGLHIHDALEKKYPIMQYTGVKDKNGKEIYEGDILRSKSDWEDRPHYIGPVIHSEGIFMVDDKCGTFLKKDWVEVLGNIYENPELLRDANEE